MLFCAVDKQVREFCMILKVFTIHHNIMIQYATKLMLEKLSQLQDIRN